MFIPSKIYYEKNIIHYELGKKLIEQYKALNVPFEEIESHNRIESLQKNPNSEFVNMKNLLIIGTRKTHKYVPNYKVSDFLVPYTSSGCSAMCLYCYLVCNYNKCSYMRLFVNREQMMDKLLRTAFKAETDLTFEIGSNSDLVLENTITGNLPWTIEVFAHSKKGYITFPTKFDMVDDLLNLDHKGKTIVRVSVNPSDIIKSIELKTSPLERRILAINKLKDAGYPVGILIAPVIMVDNWKALYAELIEQLYDNLSDKVKADVIFEVIFMTYSYVHNAINQEAFPKEKYPNMPMLYDNQIMTGRGRGKYMYRQNLRDEGEEFLRDLLKQYFPNNTVLYVV
ncbi:spore photoproduct lyase [Paludicola sp. MB14-C6]|uniref:SPL family radical SAM protein n=1 Tax=Paludihabitans sp. MB14-C6 TaxID=3070656 RepID=UPI0027DEA42F|nr:spore photoproduct lyase [Paludicola sp. MB14-C6]WMJ23617.1 spore photoproduct lyase [Paludicola sp. MB14-C6]